MIGFCNLPASKGYTYRIDYHPWIIFESKFQKEKDSEKDPIQNFRNPILHP